MRPRIPNLAGLLRRMARTAAVTVAAAAAVLGSGCTENRFKVSVSLPKDVWGNYQICYYASDPRQGLWLETTAPIHDGHYEMEGVTRYPTLVWISPGSNKPAEVVLYAERGDRIELEGADRDMLTWRVVKGNDISHQLSEWRVSNARTLAVAFPDSVNAAVARAVHDAPDLRSSALLLLIYYNRLADPEGFRTLWNSLGRDADRAEMAVLAGMADVADETVFGHSAGDRLTANGAGGRLVSIEVPVAGGGRSVMRTSDVPASVIYFNRNSDTGRAAAIDTLRSLARAYGDSARRNIAVLSLEPDSLVWLFPNRTDSLRGVLRGWMPRGETDPRLRALGVPGTPWWIVTDSTGHRLYSGPDPSPASRTFRQAMSNP